MLKIFTNKKTNSKFLIEDLPRSIAFYSPQATGKSTMAKIFARTMAEKFKDFDIYLVSLDFLTPSIKFSDSYFSDVSFKIKNGEFRGEVDNLEPEMNFKNLYVLSGSNNILDDSYLIPEEILKIITSIKAKKNSILLMDCSREIYRGSTLTALDEAEAIIFPLVASDYYITNAIKYLTFLIKDIKIPGDKISIVLNKHKSHHYSVEDVQKYIGIKVRGKVNYEDEFYENMNIPELSSLQSTEISILIESIGKGEI